MTVARTGIAEEPCLIVELVICIDGVGNKRGVCGIILTGPIIEEILFNRRCIAPVAVECKVRSRNAFPADFVKSDEAFNVYAVLKVFFNILDVPRGKGHGNGDGDGRTGGNSHGFGSIDV